MKKEKVKVTRGSKQHPELVREWLASQGATNSSDWKCNDDRSYYFVVNGLVQYEYASHWIWDIIDHEVVELKPEHVFQPFEKVLVRESQSSKWDMDIFRRYEPDSNRYIGFWFSYWHYCIPYEGNEHLLGTTDAPK